MTVASRRRLPIEIVVKRSFLYAWESREILGPPFIFYAAVTVLADFLLGITVSPTSPAIYVLSAAEQVFAMAFAVGIHRFVLAGEVRRGVGFLRWDRNFVRYVLLSLLMLVLALMATIIVMAVLGIDAAGVTQPTAPAAVFALVVMLGAALVLSRMALALPAAALAEHRAARDIWRASEGNSFRLLATALLTVLPFLVAEAGLARLWPAPHADLAEFLLTVLDGVLSAAQLIVVTIMLSLSYDVLVRGGGPPAK
jgi:hypothetical protein